MKASLARALGLILCCVCASAVAQQYPTRPVTAIVPFAAGGPTDTTARILAQSLQANLKQPVIVESAPGAGGTIGSAKAARANPDGYTLLVMHIGLATAPALYKKLPFDPVKDLEPIGQVSDNPMTLLARGNLPANNLKELLPFLKANRDKVTIANAGIGSAAHLCGLMFMSSIGIDLTTVAYKGTAPAMNDLLGGQVDLMCDQTTNTMGQIKGGKIRLIGVTSPKRLATLPEGQTLAEQGLPGFELGIWHGLFAPQGTPKPVLDRLAQALGATVRDAAYAARLAEFGAVAATPAQATPDAMRAFLASEIAKWTPIIRKAGIYAD